MFDISFTELLLVGVVALLVLGPERLPRLARDVGHWIGRARRYAHRVVQDIDREGELAELRRLRDDIEASARSVAAQAEQVTSELGRTLDDVAQARDDPMPVAATPTAVERKPSASGHKPRRRKPTAASNEGPAGSR